MGPAYPPGKGPRPNTWQAPPGPRYRPPPHPSAIVEIALFVLMTGLGIIAALASFVAMKPIISEEAKRNVVVIFIFHSPFPGQAN
jgi:hypothetical protein